MIQSLLLEIYQRDQRSLKIGGLRTVFAVAVEGLYGDNHVAKMQESFSGL